jgi:hypothetical protein
MEKKLVKMKEKTLTLLTLVFIALSISGFTYAQWNDVIIISNTMTFGSWTIRFVGPLDCSENENAKDVGQFDCYYTDEDPSAVGSFNKLVIIMSNAYPSYLVDCGFTLKNIDSLASETILDVNISDGSGELEWIWTTEHTEGFLWKDFDGNGIYDVGEEIIYVTITELVNVKLDPDETIAAQIVVHTADNAEECQKYGFEIEIVYD